MFVLAVAGLMAGCASNREAGGTGNQDEMNSGTGSNAPQQGSEDLYNPKAGAASTPEQQQP